MAQARRVAQEASKRSTGKLAQRGARRRLTLSLRLSLLAVLVALVPLAAVVGVNDYFARGTLIQQGQDALASAANASAQRIDDYLTERLLDGEALASLTTASEFLECATAPTQYPQLQCATQGVSNYGASVARALIVGIRRDKDYSQWNIYAANGQFLLSSDTTLAPGSSAAPTVPQEDLTPVAQGNQHVSGVYYSPGTGHAFVRIYTPIRATFGDPQSPVLGFLQATLNLDKVWSIVQSEHSSNGTTAFILDENGVRIADATSSNLFTTVNTLDAATQGEIVSEKRFGTTSPPQQLNLPDVASSLQSPNTTDSFQGVAQPGSSVTYQFERVTLAVDAQPPAASTTVIKWSYFALSPLTTVTQVADQQVRLSLIIAAIIAIIVALIGLYVGTRTARPVEQASQNLEGAAAVLKALASRQQSSAGEQHWVVDACKTGLDSVRYLSDAMNQAARRIVDASNWFNDYWDRLTEDQARRTVQHLQELARYIDEAARRQQASSERLDKAITVTMQVSDQLLTGATEATQSAIQLERVVSDLRRVVGGSQTLISETADDAAGELALASAAGGLSGRGPAGELPSPRRVSRLSERRAADGFAALNELNAMNEAHEAAMHMNAMNAPSQVYDDMGASAQYPMQYDQYGQYEQNGGYGAGPLPPAQVPEIRPQPRPAPPSGRIAPQAPMADWGSWNPPSQHGQERYDDGYSDGYNGRGQPRRPRDGEWR